MAGPQDTHINMDDWMNQQPVSWYQRLLACCNSKQVRRRYARQAFFKRLTLDELERRYQKHQARLRPEEDQAVRQTIEKFKQGWYIGVEMYNSIETFYSPVCPLVTYLLCLVRIFQLHFVFFPLTSYMIRSFCRKDNSRVCFAYAMIPFYPLLLSLDIIYLLTIVSLLMLILVVLILVEIAFLIGGLCKFGLKRLRTLGVFAYNCELKLVIAEGSAFCFYGFGYRYVYLIRSDKGAELKLPRASLCRTLFNNPIDNIFKNLDWDKYSYGDIENLHLSTLEVQMYAVRQQQCAVLHSRASELA